MSTLVVADTTYTPAPIALKTAVCSPAPLEVLPFLATSAAYPAPLPAPLA